MVYQFAPLTRSIAILALSLLAFNASAANDFWAPEEGNRIRHAFAAGDDPVVICLQGRKVVMQVESSAETGLRYTTRFFNIVPDYFEKVMHEVTSELDPKILIDGKPLELGSPESVVFDGMLTFRYLAARGLAVERKIYPSNTKAFVAEEWELKNQSPQPLEVSIAGHRRAIDAVARRKVVDSPLVVESICSAVEATIGPATTATFSRVIRCQNPSGVERVVDIKAEHAARRALADAAFSGPGRLETPDKRLNLAFSLQKFHVLECPIETYKGVITHNGSLRYSPGIWANDPVEYSSPVFPFFGDKELNEASLNMYRIWLEHCEQQGIDPFPGSFEHADLRLVQKHRGDNAMVLYALPKFLMFLGDRQRAEELWPLVEFAAKSVEEHRTAEGIIASKTDEMEGRYPTGTANLSTSSLAYGGYVLAADLARDLGKTEQAEEFAGRATALRKAIEEYFGATVEGFETYRYFKENDVLRGWILLPLAMDITERQQATVNAIVSDKLWPNRLKGGDILASSTRETEWSRETYYALRVLFKAGRTEQALRLTQSVVNAQVFGSKGPYPDEDAIDMLCPGSLYPRVFIEGAFGIRPTGLHSFVCTPWLPNEWPSMALSDMRAFGQSWDMVVQREGNLQIITVTDQAGNIVFSGKGPAGTSFTVAFDKATN